MIYYRRKVEKIMVKILEELRRSFSTLSRSQKKIATYILENPTTVAFMTAQQLAEQSGTSEATVVRFARAVGLEGFPNLKSKLQSCVEDRLTAAERLESYRTIGKKANLVQNVISQDLDKETLPYINIEDSSIVALSKVICSAPQVYLIGLRSARALIEYLVAYLSWFLPNIVPLAGDSFTESLGLADKSSLVLGISFPRYTQLTIDCLSFAHDQGFLTASITDSEKSPLAKVSDYHLFVPCSHLAFIDSLVLPMCAINALLLQIVECLGGEAQERLLHLEALWKRAGTYH